MRKSEASLAVIRRPIEGQRCWLSIWNARWEAYHFVGGHRRPDETHRECLVREISEELRLREGVDYRVEPAPLAHLEYSAWSSQARVETDYTMELFGVALDDRAERVLQLNPSIRWLTDLEIEICQSVDGRAVSPTMGSLIARSGLA